MLKIMQEKRKFTVGLVQMAMAKDPAENLKRDVGWCEEAALAGALVICLPELFRSDYFCQREDAELFD